PSRPRTAAPTPGARCRRGRSRLFAHEALACGADERDRLPGEHAHGCAQLERLLVRRPGRGDLRERRVGQLDRGVQRQRRELLALRLLDALGLLLGELSEAPQDLLGIPAEREHASAFHGVSVVERYRSGTRYAASTSVHNASATSTAPRIAGVKGDGAVGSSARSSRRAASPIASRRAGEATWGGTPTTCWSSRAASSASAIPSGASAIRRATSCAR